MIATPVFQLRDIAFSYGDLPALDGVSLQIHAGERVALLGANGSGKSTLLRLLDGLYFPTRGEILFQGQPLNPHRFQDEQFAFSFRRSVALLFQNPDVQLFNPTVFDEVAFAPLHLGLSPRQISTMVESVLDAFAIRHLKERPPHWLSGGEKKKVALASILVIDPDVILLDEPTASLDPRSQTAIIDFLASWGNGRKTIITATHDLHMIEDIADRSLVFESGKLIADGPTAEILQDRNLLARSNLIHSHRHRPSPTGLHAHPLLHGDAKNTQ
jgi:cobalt/nickel transport system ATP-binding protein